MADLFYSKDKGYKGLMTQFKMNRGEMGALCGYLKSSGEYTSGEPVSISQIAAINEYGSSDGRVPERSFFRTTVAEQGKALEKMLRKFSLEVLAGRMDRKRALGVAAEFFITKLKLKIASNIPPPNAPSTIAAKGSSHTLIDSGRMRDAADWEIVKGKSF